MSPSWPLLIHSWQFAAAQRKDRRHAQRVQRRQCFPFVYMVTISSAIVHSRHQTQDIPRVCSQGRDPGRRTHTPTASTALLPVHPPIPSPSAGGAVALHRVRKVCGTVHVPSLLKRAKNWYWSSARLRHRSLSRLAGRLRFGRGTLAPDDSNARNRGRLAVCPLDWSKRCASTNKWSG